MDIAICTIDWHENSLKFAGAYNHLYLFRNESIQVIKGSNMPIGLSQKAMRPFTSQSVPLQKDDMLYLFTDGYPDQFGGTDNKKLKICRFKEILMNIHREEIPFQKKLLGQAFYEWKGEKEQIDDILVIGIKY
jgi:serine phosphatase RsbU (regulator of sigma subunit)